MSLDFIYYPVSFILWCWHKVFGFVFGEASAISWVLGIIFLTFTVRGILFKPFVNQIRSMKKMQEFSPELKKLQKKYANDRQRQAMEMQKLQREHGVNPLGSCLPMLLQIPVFIGLNHVLRMFTNVPLEQKTENYFFDKAGVESYVNAKLFGVNLGDAIHSIQVLAGDAATGGWHWNVAPVAIPLMIVASIATHLTARHSVARQQMSGTTAGNPQAAMMNNLQLYIFPLGVLVFGALLPIGLLIYWLANNGWTLMQQRVVYSRIDKEEEKKKAEAVEKRNSLAPKVGQKPRVGQKPENKGNKRTTDAATANGEATDETVDETAVDEMTADKTADEKSAAPKSKNSKAGSPHRFAQQPDRKTPNKSAANNKSAKSANKSVANKSAKSTQASKKSAPKNR